MANVTDTEKLLKELNDEEAVLLIPALLYVAILMLLGVIGNILVCIFYGCKTKRTSNTFFIVVLASFDLITCLITMPIEIVDLRFFYMFTNAPACKISRFLNHFATFGSAATLLAIAIDRYRRICKPFKKQLEVKDARNACIIASVLSLLLSWPAIIFYGPVGVRVTNPYNKSISLEGFDCTTTKEEDYKSYLLAFNTVHFAAFIIASIILGVLYFLIGKVIFKHKRRRLRYSTASVSSPNSSLGKDSRETNISEQNKSHSKEFTAEKTLHQLEFEKEEVILRTNTGASEKTQYRPSWRESKVDPNKHSPDIRTVKYTTVMLVISVVFVFSFLPYLILVLWRNFQSEHELDILSDAGLVAFQIGIRSYLLNSAVNPLLYGFFNSKFRTFFYICLCPCCTKKQGELQFSSSSEAH